MADDLWPKAMVLFKKLVTAHVFREIVNEKIDRVTAELRELIPPQPIMMPKEEKAREEDLLKAARKIMEAYYAI